MDMFTELFGTQLSDNIIFTPPEVAETITNDLPPEVWNRNTKFLDTAVKSGNILIAVKTKLLSSDDLIQAFPDEQARLTHIECHQLYGIAVNNTAALISQRNLYGRLHPSSKIRCGKNDTPFPGISFHIVFTHTPEQHTLGEHTVYVPDYLNSKEDTNDD